MQMQEAKGDTDEVRATMKFLVHIPGGEGGNSFNAII